MYSIASSLWVCQVSRAGPRLALQMLRRYCISKMAKLTNSKKAAVAKALNNGSTTKPAGQQKLNGSRSCPKTQLSKIVVHTILKLIQSRLQAIRYLQSTLTSTAQLKH